MEDRLDNKIESLYKIAKLYENLIKKDYNYQYRLDAINEQLEILIELKSGGSGIIEAWEICYEEDLKTI